MKYGNNLALNNGQKGVLYDVAVKLSFALLDVK